MRDYLFCDGDVAVATVLELRPVDAGVVVVLDRTVFAPQDGGQLSDCGTIGGIPIISVQTLKEESGIIGHTVTDLGPLRVADHVVLWVDGSRRMLNSRLHTAGHLIATLVQEILPVAKVSKGQHWPGSCRVEFKFVGGTLSDAFQQNIQTSIKSAIKADLLVKRIFSARGISYVQIHEYPPLRCSGTHCTHLGSIGDISLGDIQLKKGHLTVNYEVLDVSLS